MQNHVGANLSAHDHLACPVSNTLPYTRANYADSALSHQDVLFIAEPECLVLTELTSKYNFDAFVSFHSGIQQIYVPFAGKDHMRMAGWRVECLKARLLADIGKSTSPRSSTSKNSGGPMKTLVVPVLMSGKKFL